MLVNLLLDLQKRVTICIYTVVHEASDKCINVRSYELEKNIGYKKSTHWFSSTFMHI